MDWASGALSEIRTPELVGCIGLAEDDHFVAGLKSGLALVERSSGRCTPLGHFSIDMDCRLNDGRCAPSGYQFWVGSMVETLDRNGAHLYCVDTKGNTQTVASGLICSNGLAWSPDGRTLYHSDFASARSGPTTTTSRAAPSPTNASSALREKAKVGQTVRPSTPRAATGARATTAGASSATRPMGASSSCCVLPCRARPCAPSPATISPLWSSLRHAAH